MKKRVLMLNAIGYALTFIAVLCGIAVIGVVGGMSAGGSIVRGLVWCGVFGIGCVVFGKVGTDLAMV